MVLLGICRTGLGAVEAYAGRISLVIITRRPVRTDGNIPGTRTVMRSGEEMVKSERHLIVDHGLAGFHHYPLDWLDELSLI